MGEVYRARDTKLGRDVAIKILPAAFAADSGRRVRFEREARLISQLNHPNICTLHHVGDGEPLFLVLELVEGETLHQRLIRGALPIDEALRCAIQIARALGAAHEKGIVHRDLKPGNITITPDGHAKVLDFGLAKLSGVAELGHDNESPTITIEETREGVMFGSAAYMSPEQASGKPVDRRADIWAFGCVLYEMLTGEQAFGSENVTEVLAKILERERDLSTLPASTPARVRDVIRRCLQKDARRRLQDVADARLELEDALTSTDHPAAAPTRKGRIYADWRVWLAAGAVLGAIATGVAVGVMRSGTTPTLETVRFSIEPPAMPNPYSFSVSPDGRSIAFTAASAGGPSMLFVRRIGALEAQQLSGTEGALFPFWSPDSGHIGFGSAVSPRKLKTVDVASGRVQILCDLVSNAFFLGGTWNSDNVIVFSGSQSLHRVPANGGESPVPLTKPDKSVGDVAHAWPQFLPGGRRFLYHVRNVEPSKSAVVVGSLDSGVATRLMEMTSMAAYAPPHFLFYLEERTLRAQRFDSSRLTLAGVPATIASGVLHSASSGKGAFAVSDAGTLAYRTGPNDMGQHSLMWLDRSGNTLGTVGEPHTIRSSIMGRSGLRMDLASGSMQATGPTFTSCTKDALMQRLPSESCFRRNPECSTAC